MALVHSPKVLLLDEPLNYLDLPTQEEVIKYLGWINSTMLVSTHVMSIAERLAKRVVIVNKGKVAWQGEMSRLRDMAKEERIEEVVAGLMVGG